VTAPAERTGGHDVEPVAAQNPINPFQTGPAIEIGIEAENGSDSVALHDRDVEGASGRHRSPLLDKFPRRENLCFVD